MNTLTIAVLVVCATIAYASAIPGSEGIPTPGAQPVADLQAAESANAGRYYYGGRRYGYGGGYGGYHGGYIRGYGGGYGRGYGGYHG